jgi:hypothetical protein
MLAVAGKEVQEASVHAEYGKSAKSPSLTMDYHTQYTLLKDNKMICYLSSNVHVLLYTILLDTEDSNDISQRFVGWKA